MADTRKKKDTDDDDEKVDDDADTDDKDTQDDDESSDDKDDLAKAEETYQALLDRYSDAEKKIADDGRERAEQNKREEGLKKQLDEALNKDGEDGKNPYDEIDYDKIEDNTIELVKTLRAEMVSRDDDNKKNTDRLERERDEALAEGEQSRKVENLIGEYSKRGIEREAAERIIDLRDKGEHIEADDLYDKSQHVSSIREKRRTQRDTDQRKIPNRGQNQSDDQSDDRFTGDTLEEAAAKINAMPDDSAEKKDAVMSLYDDFSDSQVEEIFRRVIPHDEFKASQA